MLVCVVLLWLFLVALWSPAGKGLTSWLSCLLCFVTFPNVSYPYGKKITVAKNFREELANTLRLFFDVHFSHAN